MKKNQIDLLQMKTTIYERKNSLDGIKCRLGITEEKISKLELIAIETIQNKTHRDKRIPKKHTSIFITV